MGKNLLLDTDILINWIRGEKWEKALLLRSDADFYYSAVSRKELFRYKKITNRHRRKMLYLLYCLREILVTPAIAQKTSVLLSKYGSRSLKVADALIAATAWEKSLGLVSRNIKDFSFIEEITLIR